MSEQKGKTLEKFAEKVTDPKVIDILFWIALPLALILVAYTIYRMWKGKKEGVE